MSDETIKELQETTKMRDALDVLSQNADRLFTDPNKSNTLRTLISEALQNSAASGPSDPAAADLDELAELVHAVVQIEDSIAEVQNAANTVLDWIGKSGRSLGMD